MPILGKVKSLAPVTGLLLVIGMPEMFMIERDKMRLDEMYSKD